MNEFIMEFPFFDYDFSSPVCSRMANSYIDGNLLSVEVNLAGVKKSNIQTEFDGEFLEVKVEDKLRCKAKIPVGFKPKNASYEDGLLTVNFERKDKRKGIPID